MRVYRSKRNLYDMLSAELSWDDGAYLGLGMRRDKIQDLGDYSMSGSIPSTSGIDGHVLRCSRPLSNAPFYVDHNIHFLVGLLFIKRTNHNTILTILMHVRSRTWRAAKSPSSTILRR